MNRVMLALVGFLIVGLHAACGGAGSGGNAAAEGGLFTPGGEPYDLADVSKEQRAVVVFYRGHW